MSLLTVHHHGVTSQAKYGKKWLQYQHEEQPGYFYVMYDKDVLTATANLASRQGTTEEPSYLDEDCATLTQVFGTLDAIAH